jgi:hypothetical protein
VHVAEVGKTAEARVVVLCKSGDEAVAFTGCQIVGILSDANGAGRCPNHLIAVSMTRLDLHVVETDAGASGLSGCKKFDPVSINWYTQLQRRGERAGRSLAENY